MSARWRSWSRARPHGSAQWPSVAPKAIGLIEDGLEPGEWLIISGQRNLIDGQTVHVTERLE